MAVLNSLGVSGRTAGPSTSGRSGAAMRVAGCSVEIVMCQVTSFRSQIADRSSDRKLQASDRTAMGLCDLRPALHAVCTTKHANIVYYTAAQIACPQMLHVCVPCAII